MSGATVWLSTHSGLALMKMKKQETWSNLSAWKAKSLQQRWFSLGMNEAPSSSKGTKTPMIEQKHRCGAEGQDNLPCAWSVQQASQQVILDGTEWQKQLHRNQRMMILQSFSPIQWKSWTLLPCRCYRWQCKLSHLFLDQLQWCCRGQGKLIPVVNNWCSGHWWKMLYRAWVQSTYINTLLTQGFGGGPPFFTNKR